MPRTWLGSFHAKYNGTVVIQPCDGIGCGMLTGRRIPRNAHTRQVLAVEMFVTAKKRDTKRAEDAYEYSAIGPDLDHFGEGGGACLIWMILLRFRRCS